MDFSQLFDVVPFESTGFRLRDVFHSLMKDKYWLYTRYAIMHTRMYRDGFAFLDTLERLNDQYYQEQQIDLKEYMYNDRRYVEFRLQLLDKLDEWQPYIKLFESARLEKPYLLPYALTKQDPKIEPYFVRQSEKAKYVHFLYLQSHRYELIKSKIAKEKAGKKPAKHKSPAELSAEEVKERFAYALFCCKNGHPVFEPK